MCKAPKAVVDTYSAHTSFTYYILKLVIMFIISEISFFPCHSPILWLVQHHAEF